MLDEVATPRVVIAGLASGTGKTTIALGLTAALHRRGRAVQTFKVGPDFIDCAYLAHVSRRPCRNLDSWMLGHGGVRESLAHGTRGADCAVVEGVMGLFDGHGVVTEHSHRATSDHGSHVLAGRPDGSVPYAFPGSTAEVARLIRSPVILVLDVATMGETAAAIALGMRRLDPELSLVGVILDRVPSEHRRQVVEDAIWEQATLPVLGALPDISAVGIPELRTGLLPVTANEGVDHAVEQLAAAMERHCNIDLIERIMAAALPMPVARRRRPPAATPATRADGVRIGVAFDDAFCFYYADNLELLEDAGAEIVPFSPLEDAGIPADVDGLYLGGGVSEVFVERLARNRAMHEAISRAHLQGMPIYAECGGLLLTARSVRTSDGAVHRMSGVVPVDIALEAGVCRSGYRDLRLSTETLLGPAGTRLRGHEFHFSRVDSAPDCLHAAYTVHDCDGEPLGCEGFASGNLVASFVHLHFGQDAALPERLITRLRQARTARARLDSVPA